MRPSRVSTALVLTASVLTASVIAALALTACSSPKTSPAASSSAGQASTAPSAVISATTSSAPSSIVGEWQRMTTCEERVAALAKAGLAKYAADSVADDGFIPGVSSAKDLNDPKHPCGGAVQQLHSHFFTADGQFGSRDASGQQVDDGTYQLVDSRTISMGEGDHKVIFHFTVTDGRTLRLMPVLPACTPEGCFEASWAVAVSYLGLPWTRISP